MENFRVKPILRTDKRRLDHSCPIYLKVTINGRSIKLPSGLSAAEEEWEQRTGMITDATSSVRNSILKRKITEIEVFLWKQVAAENEVTLEIVKGQFTKQKSKGFYNLLDECYELQFRNLKDGTKKHYGLVRRRLLEFQPKISISEINLNFLLRFENFLISKGIGVNGVATHHKILKVVINYGLKRKAIKDNPYSDFKVKKGKPNFNSLSINQIKALQSLDIPIGKNKLNRGLELTRDMFLFSCYTALRFGDVSKLVKKQVINNSYLQVVQEKTGRIVQIPLLGRSLEIVCKYLSHEREAVFPEIKNQTANRHLKRIARICEIEINVHFHLSRHSFGSIMASSGVNAFMLSKLMGHTSMRTTMMYVNIPVESAREQMAQARIFD